LGHGGSGPALYRVLRFGMSAVEVFKDPLNDIRFQCKPPVKSTQAKLEFSGIMMLRRRTDDVLSAV